MRLTADLAVLQVASVASDRELTDAEWSRLKAIRYELAEVSEKVDSRWTVLIEPELAIPVGLSETGILAATVIRDYLAEHGWTYSGQGRAFHVPSTWPSSPPCSPATQLVVVHADGLLGECFGLSPTDAVLSDGLVSRLANIAAWSELLDESTSAIYPADYPGFAIGLG